MSIQPDEIKKIAQLSRLALNPETIADLTGDIENILGLLEHIQDVDVSNLKSMSHPLDLNQRLRQDLATEPNIRDALQASAFETRHGLYLVPRVIE